MVTGEPRIRALPRRQSPKWYSGGMPVEAGGRKVAREERETAVKRETRQFMRAVMLTSHERHTNCCME